MSNSIETSFLYRNFPRFRNNSEDEVGAGGKLWGLVLFCVCAAACIALSLVLGSYDYSDPGFSRFNTKLQVSNLFGVQGAWTADLFYLLFGWGAWVFVIGLFYFLVRGLKRLRGKKVSVSPIPMGFRILAFCVLVLSCCALFFLRFHIRSAAYSSGSFPFLGMQPVIWALLRRMGWLIWQTACLTGKA